jgi:ABC-type transport system involved in cytochrome c biogenesis permease subunit
MFCKAKSAIIADAAAATYRCVPARVLAWCACPVGRVMAGWSLISLGHIALEILFILWHCQRFERLPIFAGACGC